MLTAHTSSYLVNHVQILLMNFEHVEFVSLFALCDCKLRKESVIEKKNIQMSFTVNHNKLGCLCGLFFLIFNQSLL